MAAQAYDEKFVHFVVLFNVDEDYFECHEVMEELWLEEGRNLLFQGLLQAAVGLHHWRNDNYSGAVKLFAQAEDKLRRYPDTAMGLDLRQLRRDIARSLELLRGWTERQEGEGAYSAETARTQDMANLPDTAEILQLAGQAGTNGPPPFEKFLLVIRDEELERLAADMARIPLDIRLRYDEFS